jgi:hypothetical protein
MKLMANYIDEFIQVGSLVKTAMRCLSIDKHRHTIDYPLDSHGFQEALHRQSDQLMPIQL